MGFDLLLHRIGSGVQVPAARHPTLTTPTGSARNAGVRFRAHPVVAATWHLNISSRRVFATTTSSGDPDRVFPKVRQVVAATGCCKVSTGGRWIPTVLDDAVTTQDTVTQMIAAVRRVIREVPGASEVASRWCTAHDYADPGKPKIA